MSTIQSARAVAGRFVIGLIAGSFSVAAATADSLDGSWVSDGYGMLLEIHGDEIKGSQTTAISCLPSFTAKRQAMTSEGAEAVFAIAPGQIFLVKPGDSADHKFMLSKGAASSIGFRRVGESPAACSQPAVDSPLHNFDVFWTTFDEHYPFFTMHGVNWREVRDTYRPRITSDMTADELFGILKAMIEPLHDAHTYITGAVEKRRFRGRRETTEQVADETHRRIVEIIESNYAREKLKTWCNGRLGYGVLSETIGYLRITAFGGYASSGGFDNQLKALNEALDQVFAEAHTLNGLVIDLRINYGGSDVLGVAVASRLAAHDYSAFAKKARNDAADPSSFTDPQETRVRVSTRPHFHGKVVLLTGSNTVSAGETFTMALMGRTPQVTRVGENTQGVFSDELARQLPNGFRFALPNEIFLTEDGKAFDGSGIPPHVQVPVFSKEDLTKGCDVALDEAIEILRKK
ncbi:MAG: S41 family peptidase [Pirellulales bacterium]